MRYHESYHYFFSQNDAQKWIDKIVPIEPLYASAHIVDVSELVHARDEYGIHDSTEKYLLIKLNDGRILCNSGLFLYPYNKR